MQLHEISPIHKIKRKKRIGRGGKKGTYSGRGIKGQKSRSGRRLKPAIRSIIKRYPKLRGYSFGPLTSKPAIVNVGELEKKFKEDAIVNPQSLLENKLVSKIKGRTPIVKILSGGKLTKKIIVEGCRVSESAKKKIEKSGGTVR